MQFLKCVKVALLVSGAAFTIASLPVAKFADERVDVQFNRSQIFSGQTRDLAGAYLSVSGLMSISLGMTGFSLAAWRQTRSRLLSTKQTVSELEGLVKQREQQLQLAQLSPARIQQTGLQSFLEEEDDFAALDYAAIQQQAMTPEAVPVGRAAPMGQAAPMDPAIPVTQAIRAANQAVPMHQTVPARQAAPGYYAAPVAQAPPVNHVASVNSAIAKDIYVQQPLSRIPQRPAATPALHPLRQQLSLSQATQLQAVQAQLQQQHRQARQTTAATPTAASRSNGFTVINPYQVQVAGNPGRPRNNPAHPRMA